jgi:hypothetical protein
MLARIELVWSIINKVTGPHIWANSSFGKKHLAKKATERIHLLGMRCRGKAEGKINTGNMSFFMLSIASVLSG